MRRDPDSCAGAQSSHQIHNGGHGYGDPQMHTEWSDGGGTISEMAAAAIERGYKFIAITDHTQGLKIAGELEILRTRTA